MEALADLASTAPVDIYPGDSMSTIRLPADVARICAARRENEVRTVYLAEGCERCERRGGRGGRWRPRGRGWSGGV